MASVHDRLAELAAIRPGGTVVDLGCGSGLTLAALAARDASLRLVGIDLNAARLNAARLDAVRLDAVRLDTARLDAVRLDAVRLDAARFDAVATVRADLSRPFPLGDRSADALVCHNVIELLAEPELFLVEAARVLRPGGRAVLSHTDFAGLVVHGAGPALSARILAAYGSIPQPWMGHIDPNAGRRIPGLAAAAGLWVDRVEGHVLTAHRLDGPGRPRLEEIAAAVRGHISRGLVDLTTGDVDAWWGQLAAADGRGEFFFAETAFITVARLSP